MQYRGRISWCMWGISWVPWGYLVPWGIFWVPWGCSVPWGLSWVPWEISWVPWGCSVPWGYQQVIKDTPHGTEHPVVLKMSPQMLHGIPHGTECHPRYCTHVIEGDYVCFFNGTSAYLTNSSNYSFQVDQLSISQIQAMTTLFESKDKDRQ